MVGILGIVMKLFWKKKFIFEVCDLWLEFFKVLGIKNLFFFWGMSFLEWMSYYYLDVCVGFLFGICEGIWKCS